jgi:bacterioferritin-associated ferredoxin
MYVCLCRRVTDRCVHAAIASGARDLETLTTTCRAGTGCGGCLASVASILSATTVEEGAGDQERALISDDEEARQAGWRPSAVA